MSRAESAERGRWREVAAAFLKLGAMSYGGPAIMGLMRAEVQAKRDWLSRERFVEGLALVNMLPGPLATQLSIFLGYTRLGGRGAVLAGLCFIIPVIGVIAVALLQMLPHAVPDLVTALVTLATVVALVLWRLGPLPLLVVGGAAGAALQAR